MKEKKGKKPSILTYDGKSSQKREEARSLAAQNIKNEWGLD